MTIPDKALVLLSTFCLAVTSVFAQTNHYESLILPADNWRYDIPQSQPDLTWTTWDFDDSSWLIGASSIGYGDNDDSTVVQAGTMTVYLRKSFDISDTASISGLYLDIDYDDGFVGYMNGAEIARANLSGTPMAFDQPSDTDHEAVLYQGGIPERFTIDKTTLLPGVNILAVEVHNYSPSSSDLTIIPVLSAGISTDAIQYRPVPAWFQEPPAEFNFTSSNLPIVILNTENDAEIPDDPKINAQMIILSNDNGERNVLADQNQEGKRSYSGAIKIEVRGSTSQTLEKKQYGLTTYDAAGEKENVSLLDMPEENDWILNGLAFDASYMRDYFSYTLSRNMGQYAARGQYCELILNGEYRGLYVLQEKLKRDGDRIDIEEMSTSDNAGVALTGGYIIKADKLDGSDLKAWGMPNYLGFDTDFVQEEPKQEEVTTAQHDYIEDYFWSLANTASAHNSSVANGYPSVIDLPSFIDFMLLNELASNVDGYQFSTYFHKDRGGKLRAGPIWDFNLCYGNDLTFWGLDRSHTDVWQFDNGDNVGAKFWKDLFSDPVYKCYLSKRWKELTSGSDAPWSTTHLFAQIDQIAALISEAAERNGEKWSAEVTTRMDEELANMKAWIVTRKQWITDHLGSGNSCTGESAPTLAITQINYHPNSVNDFDDDDLEFIGITNYGSEPVDAAGVYFGGLGIAYQFAADVTIPANFTVWLASNSSAFEETYGKAPFDSFVRHLSNKSQTLQLLNAYGQVIDEVTYADKDPWPESVDGDGAYLELITVDSDHQSAASWQATTAPPEIEILEETILGMHGDLRIILVPNPVADQLTISTQENILHLAIIDLQGRTVWSKSLPDPKGIDLSRIESGLYVVRLVTASGRISEHKLLISH